MKAVNHQETHTKIEETPSNNRDTNNNMKEFVSLRAGYVQHTSLYRTSVAAWLFSPKIGSLEMQAEWNFL